MLDVRRLRLLRDLAHLGTIAEVAAAAAYTPSAVSQQLAALEREAGVPLLRRTGRRVTLTEAGTVLVERAEAVLAALEEASAALAGARTGLTGPLRIGAFPTAVRTLLPAALVALGRDHPGLELMVQELDPAAVPAALRAGRLDVALVHDYDYVPIEPDPALDTEPLIEETMYLATAAPPGAESTGRGSGAPAAADRPGRDDPAAADRPGRDDPAAADRPGRDDPAAADRPGRDDPVRAARDAAWILGSPGTVCHTMAVRACQAAGFTPRVRHHADDFVTVLTLVAAGQGVSFVPGLATGDAPPGVLLTPLPIRRRTRFAYRRGARRHPAVAAALDAIRDSSGAHPVGTPSQHDRRKF